MTTTGAARDDGAATTLQRVVAAISYLLAAPLPFRVRDWDGHTTVEPADAPILWVRRTRALRRLLWQPDRLGLARAWVAGDVDVEGDFVELLLLLMDVAGPGAERLRPAGEARAELMSLTVLLGAVGPEPVPPAVELTNSLDHADLAGEPAAHELAADEPAADQLAVDEPADGSDEGPAAPFDGTEDAHADAQVGRSTTVPGGGSDAGPDGAPAPARDGAAPQAEDSTPVSRVLFSAAGADQIERVVGSSRIDAVGTWHTGETATDTELVAARYAAEVASKAGARSGAAVLDVAPGWGGIAASLAAEHGLAVTCVAASRDQLRAIAAFAESRGVADAIDVRLVSDPPDGEPYEVLVATSLAVPADPVPTPATPEQSSIARLSSWRYRRARRNDPPAQAAEALGSWVPMLAPGGRVVAQILVAAGAPSEDSSWLAESYPVPTIRATRLGSVVNEMEDHGLVVLSARSRQDDLERSAAAWLQHQQRSMPTEPDAADLAAGQARTWALALAILGAQARRGRYHVVDLVAEKPTG